MNWLLKFFILYLLLSARALSAVAPVPRNTTTAANPFTLLDNTTTLRLITNYNSSLVQYTDYPFITHLLNPCNSFTLNNDSKSKPLLPINKNWLSDGKNKIAPLQKKIQASKLQNAEQKWFTEHAIPRLTFSWSLYHLANITQHIPRENWTMSRKHQVSHALIRTIAHQQNIDLSMRIQYLNSTQIIAEKPLEQLHVLLIKTVNEGFIPSLIFNPPQHLIEARATTEKSIVYFWAELVWNPDVICCDSEQHTLFSPYLLANAVPLKNITSIGILPVIGPFAPPENFSLQAKEIFQQEWQKFLQHCRQFLKNEPRPPAYSARVKNEL